MEKRAVADLKGAEYNPRKISEKAMADLKESIVQFGAVEPVVVNTDGTIIGGHQRAQAYAQLGVEEVLAAVPSRRLKPDEEKQLNLRLNKNVGEWDWAKLGAFEVEFLQEIGFDEAELRMNIRLEDAEAVDLDGLRMEVLTIVPPESPRIKERASIHFESMEDYQLAKKAVEDGVITAERLLKMI